MKFLMIQNSVRIKLTKGLVGALFLKIVTFFQKLIRKHGIYFGKSRTVRKEESITSGYVKNENPDAIINIVDATNLSRSLFFTTQLLELGIPVVVALINRTNKQFNTEYALKKAA